jgi:hypothetical protein
MPWKPKRKEEKEVVRYFGPIEDPAKQFSLEADKWLGGMAADLATVRNGADVSERKIPEILADYAARENVAPEALANALIAYEEILGTDKGLDADQNGGEPALAVLG